MSEKIQRITQHLDEIKVVFEEMAEAQEKLEADTEALRTARREAEETSWKAAEKIKELSEELEKAKADLDKAETELSSYKDELEEAQKKADSLEGNMDEMVGDLKRERDELRKEMDEIEAQLTRVSALYRETAAEKEKLEEKVDVSDLLSIYITLIETVFAGKPHARVLYTLHDVGAAITRKHIESSTGIMPTHVKKAIFDLRNAGLVDYDEESDEVNLIKDIL